MKRKANVSESDSIHEGACDVFCTHNDVPYNWIIEGDQELTGTADTS